MSFRARRDLHHLAAAGGVALAKLRLELLKCMRFGKILAGIQALGIIQLGARLREVALLGEDLGLDEMRLGAAGTLLEHLRNHLLSLIHVPGLFRLIDLIDGRQCVREHGQGKPQAESGD